MNICFVIPTYSDEISLKKLIEEINKELKNFITLILNCSINIILLLILDIILVFKINLILLFIATPLFLYLYRLKK